MTKLEMALAAYEAVRDATFGSVEVCGVRYLITPHYHYSGGLRMSVFRQGYTNDGIDIYFGNDASYTLMEGFTGAAADKVFWSVMAELNSEAIARVNDHAEGAKDKEFPEREER